MIVDVHCHYTFSARPPGVTRFSFEPVERDSPLACDSCLAPRVQQRWTSRAIQWIAGFGWRRRPAAELDALLEGWYEQHVGGPGPCARTALLAFDAYHDDAGRRPPLPERRGERASDMYTSNSLVREVCRRRPERYAFGASVHPYRADALACIDEVFAAGACLLKWLPQHQNINCRDPRTVAVLRHCAAIGLPVLVHYGPEFTLTTQHPEFSDVAPLLEVLRTLRRQDALPTVIVPHVATSVWPGRGRSSFHTLVDALLNDFFAAPLYADISALTAWGKIPYLHRVARMQELHPKLLFGTDFPVPLALPLLRSRLGSRYREIVAEPSWQQRAVLIYRHLGFNDIVFSRAAELLPNIRRTEPIKGDEP